MGFFSFLTGGSKTAEKVIDGVSSGIDMAFFTDEEKSIASRAVLDWKLEYAKATAGQSISRRVIAFIVSGLWAFLIIISVVAGLINGKDSESVKFLFEIMKDIVNPPFMIILGFYFLAHVVGKGRGQS